MSGVVIEKVDGLYVFPVEDFFCAGLRQYALGDIDLILHKAGLTGAARIRLRSEHRAFVVTLQESIAGVRRIVATDESTLLMEFDGGQRLEVPSGEYEAWEIEGAGFFAVAPAGGGEPAIWDSTSKRYLVVDGKLVERTEGEDE
jgi:hypothetical protein